MLKVTMISNFINHHQMPFCEEMYKRLGDNFCFIQTEPMEQERADMGWAVDEESIPYLRLLYKDERECKRLINMCDMLLVGWQEREDLILPRIQAGKLTVRISERIYREGQWRFISPRGLIRKYKEHIRFRKKKNVFLLCNGAYVASDFHLIRSYPGRMFKFGYFPKFRELDWSKKPPMEKSIEIVWAGRFIELKHPEYVVRLAADLVDMGFKFRIHFVGSGPMEDMLKLRVKEGKLEDYVYFYGFLKPEDVRELMDRCHIHLFTSNYLEGWGAVVNEGMNSGCAEVVCEQVGAAPFLIRHGVNGLLYEAGYENFCEQVLSLMEDTPLIEELGRRAYETIAETWNASCAADRILELYENYTTGKVVPPRQGPLSIAKVIKPLIEQNE